jgi:hypothetical protein
VSYFYIIVTSGVVQNVLGSGAGKDAVAEMTGRKIRAVCREL